MGLSGAARDGGKGREGGWMKGSRRAAAGNCRESLLLRRPSPPLGSLQAADLAKEGEEPGPKQTSSLFSQFCLGKGSRQGGGGRARHHAGGTGIARSWGAGGGPPARPLFFGCLFPTLYVYFCFGVCLFV